MLIYVFHVLMGRSLYSHYLCVSLFLCDSCVWFMCSYGDFD